MPKKKAPKKFVPPSLDECKLHAQKTELNDIEAEKFFYYYASKGWLVGKAPMKNWHMAMAGWKLRSQSGSAEKIINSAQIVVYQKELDRVLQRLASIRNTYGDHQTWTDQDKKLYAQLVARRTELKKLLGVVM